MNILHIDTSLQKQGSHSRDISKQIIDKIKEDHPTIKVTTRDLGVNPIPHLSEV